MVIVETTVQEEAEIPDLTEPVVRRVVRRALNQLGRLDPGSRYIVEVTFVTEDTIRELNMKYRGIDSPTDVLSFSQDPGDDEEEEFPLPPEGDGDHLGDVVICPAALRPEADELRELAFLACHGTLHLLGWTHCDEQRLRRMNRVTEDILAGVFPPEM
ncbi:MAG: rRNA maturation RNase YbeY [Bacillota bacterium]